MSPKKSTKQRALNFFFPKKTAPPKPSTPFLNRLFTSLSALTIHDLLLFHCLQGPCLLTQMHVNNFTDMDNPTDINQ